MSNGWSSWCGTGGGEIAAQLSYIGAMEHALAMIYYWLKAGHIIFVIFWMAGLFMLPRYFVYHQESAPDSPENALWIERERKLLKIILTPSLVVVWVLGLLLAYIIGAFGEGWFYAKLALVLALSGYHGWLVSYAKRLARGERRLDGRKLRMLNEVPGVAAALIVILVIIKPF
jgi:putative membrane protein